MGCGESRGGTRNWVPLHIFSQMCSRGLRKCWPQPAALLSSYWVCVGIMSPCSRGRRESLRSVFHTACGCTLTRSKGRCRARSSPASALLPAVSRMRRWAQSLWFFPGCGGVGPRWAKMCSLSTAELAAGQLQFRGSLATE